MTDMDLIAEEEAEIAAAINWPELAKTSRRLVFRHADGRMEIFGHTTEQPPSILERQGGELINLVACKSRYYVYKPLMLPENSGTFTTGQGHFDKGQR